MSKHGVNKKDQPVFEDYEIRHTKGGVTEVFLKSASQNPDIKDANMGVVTDGDGLDRMIENAQIRGEKAHLEMLQEARVELTLQNPGA